MDLELKIVIRNYFLPMGVGRNVPVNKGMRVFSSWGKGAEVGLNPVFCAASHPDSAPAGAHTVLDCPKLKAQRSELLPTPPLTWEQLDHPIWRKYNGQDEPWDTVEAFFHYLYREIS